MDEPSKELILNLLHQEAQQEIESWKGKQKAGVLSDWHLALSEWTTELQQCARDIQDHRMALSVAKAVYDDGVALAVAVQEEGRALADRITALRLGGQLQLAQNQPLQRLAAETNKQATEALESSYFTLQQADSMSGDAPQSCTAESSKDAEKRHLTDSRPSECVACTELYPMSDMFEAPCLHHYCRTCTSKLVEDSLIDESLFPPRCCRMPILLSSVRGYLGQELARQYEEKKMEREDPYRTYCSNAACAKYLMPFQVQGYTGTCKNCCQQTCTLCKRQAHPGAPCIDEYNEVLHLAKEQGWQGCARCRNIFCYVCGTKWKKCTCEVWDENRLLLRAQHVAGRDQVEPPAQAEVQRVVQDLLERHECDHEGRWKRINRGQECEECHEYLPDFILECRQCHLRACVRCRMNRL
ncbi:hypothetical protein BO78DRAFT_410911 [Aspergillus sclerotiicarbonarius CBS 121057]|uniref:IBR domain-containing protein n=1 Tax=Aspergillus sclerotiicarbonarius (strain CBS 121057 / IBT 28362) TaxID=1448318 RepID=A0A319DWA0_ASPSB|nr:hypothetical protein BO78DRAFT_410911 [Aspergillus sclerotiicarbonarius CBS 121057]